MADPVKPEDVPAALVRIAMESPLGCCGHTPDNEPEFRAMLAAVLTEARQQVADFACGERALTNQEMTRLISAEEHGDDQGEIYLGYVRRLIGVWPRGYGA